MRLLAILSLVVLVTGCGMSSGSFSATKKYSPRDLQRDYFVYQQVLEEAHPGLYWYTSKDSMDHYFNWGRQQLNDSLTEPQFRSILSYVTSKINCGHTAVRSSKKFSRRQDSTAPRRVFPLSLKLWENQNTGEDTMVVTANVYCRDSVLRRGTVVTKINGKTPREIVDTLFKFIPTDGYNRTHKFQMLSNRGFFGSLYSTVFGYSRRYEIEYVDPAGRTKTVNIPLYRPGIDSPSCPVSRPVVKMPQPSRRERRQQQLYNVRLLKIDSANHTAFMDLHSFGRGYGLKRFFRRSFKYLQQNRVSHLIIDVRSNGGGSVTNSTSLTRYISNHRFKGGDSLYAINKRNTYNQYIQNDFFNRLFMTFFTRKRKDGYYHFGYFENHFFKPKKKNHFDGKVYVLTGGNSFSATTLFLNAVMAQDNVTVIGEETGGGAYGNSAWLIPDVTLPKTGVRFRLPLFRLVIDKDAIKNGRGIQPEVPALPTAEAIRKGVDFKVEKAMELIKADKDRLAAAGNDAGK